MKEQSILIVEDNSIIAHSIAQKVKEFGYTVSKICSNGHDAISYILKNSISAVLMDINIKGDIDGIQTAKEILKHKDIPILYLTAYMDERTIERAIDTNPSAYLSKPINTSDLFASLKIAFKNYSADNIKVDIRLDDEFNFERESKQLFHKGEFVKLSKKETQLLYLFIQRKNQLITIETVELEIWPDKDPNENTRRALISRLRAKLNHKFIDTISGVGYRLNI